MTPENKKENLSEELARATECLTEAEILSSHELYTGAVSRLYYYVLHSVRALLLTKGKVWYYSQGDVTHLRSTHEIQGGG